MHQTIDELYNSHEHLIKITIDKNYSSPSFRRLHCITTDDLNQYGRIGLYEACRTFDPKKNSSFRTYAINHINWMIKNESKADSLRGASKWSTKVINCDSFDRVISGVDGELINIYDLQGREEVGYFNINEEEKINFLLNKIREEVSVRAAEILELRIQGHSVVEVAKILGVAHQGISAVLIRHSEKIKDLINKYK